jgi:hypothetical protein
MRLKHLPLAALAALSLLAGTVATPTVADARDRDRGVRADRGGDRIARADRNRGRDVRRHVNRSRDVRRHVSRDRDRHVTRRHVTRHAHRHHRHHHRDRFVVRSTAYLPFVVLGSPVVYRAYGPGYCRALHRGRHWAPGIGWHSGRHVGRVRC